MKTQKLFDCTYSIELKLVSSISTKNTTQKSRELILSYLQKNKSASTGEIITFVSIEAKDCVDKVPQVLLTLSKEKKLVKVISKEKKGFIWSLI